jgi:phosphoribosylanthranilate isomerase
VQPDALQFHGRESDTWCGRFDRPFIKAIAMGEGAAALPRLHDYPHAAALLLDGHGWGEAGGSGRAFEWSLMPTELGRPLVLAGGLDPSNVAEAIRTARPWAVDVASGVETSPGIKDAAKMERFIAAVRRASTP